MSNQPKVLVVGNKKGGAGKTTISIHMAGILKRYGARVLLIDQDTQRSSGDAHKLRGKLVGKHTFDYQYDPTPLERDGVLAKGAGYDFVIVDTPPGTAEADGDKTVIRPETLNSFTASDLVVIPTQMDRTDIQSVFNYMTICANHLARLKARGISPDRRAIVVPNCLHTNWSYKDERRIIEKAVSRADDGRGVISIATVPVLQYRQYSKTQWVGKTAADLDHDRARYLLEKTVYENILAELGLGDPRPKKEIKLADQYYSQTVVRIYGGTNTNVA